MTLAQFIAEYGYWAILAGCLLEGETLLMMGGFAAHQGQLSLPWVLVIAFVGGTLGDQFFFWLGRRWWPQIVRRFPGIQPRARTVGRLLLRHDALLIIGIRFMYGLRIVGPIAIGALAVAPRRFAAFNMLGAAIWALLVGGFGFLLGDAVDKATAGSDRFQGVVPLLLMASAAVFALVRVVLNWRSAKREALNAHPSPNGGRSGQEGR